MASVESSGRSRVTVTRADVIAFRFGRHQLDRPAGSLAATDVDLLDIGVQDTGIDASAWALASRGARPTASDELVLAWTLRGAPHAYRRREIADVMTATSPFSEADARSRVFDAARPLRAAGIEVLDALRTMAREMRDVVRTPTAKGEVSAELTRRLDAPYVRLCRPCSAIHPHENTFRLAALQAGIELVPATSPPTLERIPGAPAPAFEHLGSEAGERFDVIRGYLRFYGPAPVQAIARFLDAPVGEISANLPPDVVEVDLDGGERGATRLLLASDVGALVGAAGRVAAPGTVRLVGPYDPYLQLRDREVLVTDQDRRKQLWPVLGRPGAVLVDGEVVGAWRPRTQGRAVTITVEPWVGVTGRVRAAVQAEAERLAAHRGVALRALDGV